MKARSKFAVCNWLRAGSPVNGAAKFTVKQLLTNEFICEIFYIVQHTEKFYLNSVQI